MIQKDKTKMKSFMIEEELHHELKIQAAKDGKTQSEIVNNLIKEYLENKEE